MNGLPKVSLPTLMTLIVVQSRSVKYAEITLPASWLISLKLSRHELFNCASVYTIDLVHSNLEIHISRSNLKRNHLEFSQEQFVQPQDTRNAFLSASWLIGLDRHKAQTSANSNNGQIESVFSLPQLSISLKSRSQWIRDGSTGLFSSINDVQSYLHILQRPLFANMYIRPNVHGINILYISLSHFAHHLKNSN